MTSNIQLPYDDSFGYWFTGLSDGEACFYAGLHRWNWSKKEHKLVLHTRFFISLRYDDIATIETLRATTGIGNIDTQKAQGHQINPAKRWMVTNLESFKRIIIPQFERYPLRTKKARDFLIWKQIVLLRENHTAQSRVSVVDEHLPELIILIDKLRNGRKI